MQNSSPTPPGPFSDFVFAVCRAGSEKLLKKDVAARSGTVLRPAFMRPQVLTFKAQRPADATFRMETPFARVSGISLGMFADAGALAKAAHDAVGVKPVHLHFFPRETPEDGVPPEVWAEVDLKRSALAAAMREAGCVLRNRAVVHDDELVLDVVLNADGDKMLLGAHEHGPHRHPLPGALPRITLPENVPSRAWLKMEQAISYARLDGPKALPGKIALELGCAPGGAVLSLLQHGMNVVGVDNADMDPDVIDFAAKGRAKFTHMRVSAGALLGEEIPRPVHLLVSDMNVAPPVMLGLVERVQARVRARVIIMTLKLNDATVAWNLPKFIERIRVFAPSPVRAMQLPANRAEICVIAGEFTHGGGESAGPRAPRRAKHSA